MSFKSWRKAGCQWQGNQNLGRARDASAFSPHSDIESLLEFVFEFGLTHGCKKLPSVQRVALPACSIHPAHFTPHFYGHLKDGAKYFIYPTGFMTKLARGPCPTAHRQKYALLNGAAKNSSLAQDPLHCLPLWGMALVANMLMTTPCLSVSLLYVGWCGPVLGRTRILSPMTMCYGS